MNVTVKKCVSLALALTLSAGLLCGLTGCNQTEAVAEPNGTAVGAVNSTAGSETRDGVFTEDHIETDTPQDMKTAVVSDAVWLDGGVTIKKLVLGVTTDFDYIRAQLVIEKLDSGTKRLRDYSGNVLGEYDDIDQFFEGLAVVEKDGKYGYIDANGQVVIPLEYDDAYRFSEGLADVKKDGKYGYIDANGQVVIPLEYDYTEPFSEGLARVRKDENRSYIDAKGQIVIPIEYDDAYSFSEGLAWVKKGEKWGCIDTKGQLVIPLEYDRAGGSFSEGLAYVYKDSKYGYVDIKGQIVTPLEYDSVSNFYEGFATVGKKWDGSDTVKYGCIDTTGQLVIPMKYYDMQSIGDGFFMCQGNFFSKFFINPKKQIKFQLEYGLYMPFSEGLARVSKGSKHGYIDTSGQLVIPLEYDNADDFSGGLAPVRKDEKWMLIDTQGRVVLTLEFDDAKHIQFINDGDLLVVEMDDRCGFCTVSRH